MKTARVTSSGQLSIPAEIRRRWGTSVVTLDDRGDTLVIRPLPADPIAAARGSLKGRLPPASVLREQARRDDESAMSRRR